MAVDFLSAGVNSDGTVNATASPDNNKQSTKGTSTLGKDAFLNLLVAQMKYQDPLNPTSDTEWIAQMATFTSLEEMQNMNQTMSNMQALNLVGQNVIMNSEGTLVGGKVDYVVMQDGKAYLAIKDALYSVDDLDTVTSEEYLKKLEAEKNGTTEEEKSDTEKLLEAIDKLVGKMDSVGTTIDKAAESISDAAGMIRDAADSVGSSSSSTESSDNSATASGTGDAATGSAATEAETTVDNTKTAE